MDKPKKIKKINRNIYLTPECNEILIKITEDYGLSFSGAVNFIIKTIQKELIELPKTVISNSINNKTKKQ